GHPEHLAQRQRTAVTADLDRILAGVGMRTLHPGQEHIIDVSITIYDFPIMERVGIEGGYIHLSTRSFTEYSLRYICGGVATNANDANATLPYRCGNGRDSSTVD